MIACINEGTGKTLIGKAIAHQSGATFFNISASSLTSKWIGEGEKLVRTLFAVASVHQPAIIFIDEVDSMLTQRSSDENEASRRIKTEFLVQLDGAGTHSEDRILVIGATNRPQELDEAARRRFVKRLYIPLPDDNARHQLVTHLLTKNTHILQEQDVTHIVEKTRGFSGADLRSLCTEAAMGPIRDLSSSMSFDDLSMSTSFPKRNEVEKDIGGGNLHSISAQNVPPITSIHFDEALKCIRSSISKNDLGLLKDWNLEFGTFPRATDADNELL